MMAVLRGIGLAATYVWLPILVVLAWVAVSGATDNFYMPIFSDTMAGVGELLTPPGLQEQVVPTLVNLLIGFAIAAVVGVVLGIVIGRVRVLAEATAPIIGFVRSIAPPALLPLAILILGIGTPMKIGLIAFGALWPTLLSTIDAIRGEDPGLRDVTEVYAVRPMRRLFQVSLPAASPQIFAGLRTSLLYAITLIVLSEMVATSFGLGYSVLLAQRTFQVNDMWAAIIALGIVGLVLNFAFVGIERIALRWHLSRGTEKGGSWIR